MWDTAVLYQLVHAVALLVVGVLAERSGGRALSVAGWAFIVGIVLFSGSLYLLVLGDVRALGPVTPVGGVSFLVGWLALATAGLSRPPG